MKITNKEFLIHAISNQDGDLSIYDVWEEPGGWVVTYSYEEGDFPPVSVIEYENIRDYIVNINSFPDWVLTHGKFNERIKELFSENNYERIQKETGKYIIYIDYTPFFMEIYATEKSTGKTSNISNLNAVLSIMRTFRDMCVYEEEEKRYRFDALDSGRIESIKNYLLAPAIMDEIAHGCDEDREEGEWEGLPLA